MKHLYIKIFIAALVIVSCSKDSDEDYSQSNVQTTTNNSTGSTTGTSTGSTTGTSTGSTTGTSTDSSSSQADTFDRGSILAKQVFST